MSPSLQHYLSELLKLRYLSSGWLPTAAQPMNRRILALLWWWVHLVSHMSQVKLRTPATLVTMAQLNIIQMGILSGLEYITSLLRLTEPPWILPWISKAMFMSRVCRSPSNTTAAATSFGLPTMMFTIFELR